MCNFFSCVSDGKGNVYYFNAEQRKALKKHNPNHYEPDSHTSIADYYGFKYEKEDELNKWEYDPFARDLKLDTCNTICDVGAVKNTVEQIDFTKYEEYQTIKFCNKYKYAKIIIPPDKEPTFGWGQGDPNVISGKILKVHRSYSYKLSIELEFIEGIYKGYLFIVSLSDVEGIEEVDINVS